MIFVFYSCEFIKTKQMCRRRRKQRSPKNEVFSEKVTFKTQNSVQKCTWNNVLTARRYFDKNLGIKSLKIGQRDFPISNLKVANQIENVSTSEHGTFYEINRCVSK